MKCSLFINALLMFLTLESNASTIKPDSIYIETKSCYLGSKGVDDLNRTLSLDGKKFLYLKGNLLIKIDLNTMESDTTKVALDYNTPTNLVIGEIGCLVISYSGHSIYSSKPEKEVHFQVFDNNLKLYAQRKFLVHKEDALLDEDLSYYYFYHDKITDAYLLTGWTGYLEVQTNKYWSFEYYPHFVSDLVNGKIYHAQILDSMSWTKIVQVRTDSISKMELDYSHINYRNDISILDDRVFFYWGNSCYTYSLSDRARQITCLGQFDMSKNCIYHFFRNGIYCFDEYTGILTISTFKGL